MKLSSKQVDPEQIVALANEACRLVLAGELAELAAHFGYAVALGRSPANAVREDLASSVVSAGGSALDSSVEPEVEVRYFKPGESFCAVAECRLGTVGGSPVLVELIISTTENDFYATVEQISAAV